MNLRTRSSVPELMDNEGNAGEIKDALSELKLINKYLGGNSATASGIKFIRGKYKLGKIRVLDAGSGTSDILFHNNSEELAVTSFDKNFYICSLIKENVNKNRIICGDVLHLPLKKQAFDVVHASLFVHHFNDEEIIKILHSFSSLAKYGVVINDLQRSYAAFYGFKLLSVLFSKNRLVKNDGLVSVMRGFKKRELTELLDRTGLKYSLERRWAFRWLIVIYSDERI